MATLVLSAVGTALGGPFGGALGGLLGQPIDQVLLRSGARHGPRLGDLSVQTSSYGTPIPQVFGRMRVAGTVVWATDLKEEESIEGGGKSSPEGTASAYSANIAVALSSRPIRTVKRIWADGKLIRGEAGDFKVKTKFRLLTGDEDQEIDPLIGSVETVSKTPAYRGIALAIFEEFQLAEFGNRIPALSFEVEADETPVLVGQLLAESSGGLIGVGGPGTLAGFAAHGSSIAEALRPLIETFDVVLDEREGQLKGPAPSSAIAVGEDELGCAIDEEPKPRLEHRRDPSSALPASRTLIYYDPERDYQAGQMRASGGGLGHRDERMDLPAVVTAEQARQLVERGLARRYAETDGVKAWLPPARISLRPGDVIRLPGTFRPLTVQSVTIEGFAVGVEARPAATVDAELPADPGRSVSEPDLIIGRTDPFLIELPAMGDAPEAGPRIAVAASNIGRWKPVPVELVAGSDVQASMALTRRAIAGRAISVLPASVPAILDDLSGVTVQLTNPDDILFNADQDALMAGANLAMLGDELLQFGRAQQVGPGAFRLTKLLRGRRGTEWAAFRHEVADAFVMIEPARLSLVDLPAYQVGSVVKCTSFGIGDAAPLPNAERLVSGEAMRPPSPCHLRLWRDGATLHAGWIRRTHRGWSWADGLDAGSDDFPERYRITLTGPRGAIALETSTPLASFEFAAIPANPGETIDVRVAMIGPMALSRDARASFTI